MVMGWLTHVGQTPTSSTVTFCEHACSIDGWMDRIWGALKAGGRQVILSDPSPKWRAASPPLTYKFAPNGAREDTNMIWVRPPLFSNPGSGQIPLPGSRPQTPSCHNHVRSECSAQCGGVGAAAALRHGLLSPRVEGNITHEGPWQAYECAQAARCEPSR